MENPFEYLAKELATIKAQQAEILHMLRSGSSSGGYGAENPMPVKEAAKLFGIARQTLYQNKNKIRHIKQFGKLYFYASDLRAYIEEGFIYKGERNF